MAEQKKAEIFEYKFTPGKKLVYLISIHGTVEVETPTGSQASPIHVEMEIEQNIEKVENGVADIFLSVASARVFSGSESTPLPEEGQNFSMTMDTHGNVQYKAGSGPWKGSEFAQLVFPSKPLAVGNFWFQEAEINSSGAPMKTRTKYILSGYETLGKRECAVFYPELGLESGKNNPAEPTSHSNGKIYFSQDLGQVVKAVVLSTFSFLMPVDMSANQVARTKTTLHTEMRLLTD